MSYSGNIKVIYILLSFFLVSCSSSESHINTTGKKHLTGDHKTKYTDTKSTIVDSPDNDFDLFFKKFQIDSTFQKSHVLFPLKYKISGDEGEVDSTRFITPNEWKFTRLFISNEGKLILKKIKKSSTEIDIKVQIEDTGFENEFTFLRKNNGWYLDLVVDNSD